MDATSPPDLSLTDSVIRRQFDSTTLDRGRMYEQRGRVQNLHIEPDGSMIAATTVGSMPDPYVQQITLKRVPFGPLMITGRCSCPVGRGCKHLAAVLLAAHRQRSGRSSQFMADASSAAASKPPPPPLGVPKRRGRPRLNPLPVTVSARGADGGHDGAPAGTAMPNAINAWLTSLDGAEDDESEDYPASVRNRIFYVLDQLPTKVGVPELRIQTMNVLLRTNNLPGAFKPYAPANVTNQARFVRPSDRGLLTWLLRRQRHQTVVAGEEDTLEVLRRMIATGRAVWGEVTGPRISEGASRGGTLGWQMTGDGHQSPVITVPDGLLAVRLPAPWYVDPVRGTMGPINLGMAAAVAGKILAAPPIPAELTARVGAEVARRLPGFKASMPSEVPAPKVVKSPMVPHLRLLTGTLPADPFHGRGIARRVGNGLFEVPLARLTFGYGILRLAYSDQRHPKVITHDGQLYEPKRDIQREGETVERLKALGFQRVAVLTPSPYRHAHTDDLVLSEQDSDWLEMLTETVPALRAAGWAVSIDDSFPYQILTSDSVIDGELIEGSGIDWLELNLGVMVNGERVDLVPALIRLINRPELLARLEGDDNEAFVIPLPGGRRWSLPIGRIRPTLQALMELSASGGIDVEAEKIGFSRLEAAELTALEERTGLVLKGGETLRALGQQLRDSGGAIPAALVPKTFKGTLRPYQAQGVNWLQFLAKAGLGGVLADDMGLGKTVQTLAHLLIEQKAGRLTKPALIVCPTSLIPNWTLEAEKFAPGLKVLVLHGAERKRLFHLIPKHDLVLTTYPLLARDHDVLTAQDWHVVILDEAQTIKNPQAETTRQALRLKANQRLCLSGTPLQNHLGELWSLFDFLAPGFLGSQRSFKGRYRTPIEKHGDEERQGLLTKRVKPFLLRRTKDEVATDLPPKTEINEVVEMESAQRGIYDGIRLSMHARVKAAIAEKGMARSGIIILDALLKLRQACCDPRLIKLKAVERAKAGSAKLDRLMEMLTVMLAEGRRVLVFSQFTEMLSLIEERFKEDGLKYVILTGDTKDRGAPVRKFQKGDVPLFLISLKAGGVGLNLTAADTVIHYDPWWNPAVEDQATDRAHRIGQEKKVFVHRLVTVGTIEEKMEALKAKKRGLVASVLDAEKGGALKMTEADVDALFGG